MLLEPTWIHPCYVTPIAMRTVQYQGDHRGLCLPGVFSQNCTQITPACLCVLTVRSFFVGCNSPLCRWRGTGLMPVSASIPLAGCWNPTPPKRNLCVSEHWVWLTEFPQACIPLLFPNKKNLFGWGPAKIYALAWFSTLSPISVVSVGQQVVCRCKSSWDSFLKISVNRKWI